MSSANPYAAPATREPEAPAALPWQLDGAGLLARHQVLLPAIDLETGANEGEMVPVARTHTGLRLHRGLGFAALVMAWSAARQWLPFANLWLLLGLVTAGAAWGWLIDLRGGPGARVTVIEQRQAARERRRLARQKTRSTIATVGAGLLLVPLFVPHWWPDWPWSYSAVMWSGAVALWSAQGIWALCDRQRVRCTAGPAGWLRLTPLHPRAREHLAALEGAARVAHAAAGGRKRLVCTSYYHRLPLRSLLGKPPWSVGRLIKTALLKALRSKMLEKETYHPNEADPVPAATLCLSLRARIEAWCRDHPEWTTRLAERCVSPDGSLTGEGARLMAPEQPHVMFFTIAWATRRQPSPEAVHYGFAAWTKTGTFVSTSDFEWSPFQIPGIDAARVEGKPEQVWQSHLARCAGHDLDPIRDLADLQARVHQTNQVIHDFHTRMGWHSPLREVG